MKKFYLILIFLIIWQTACGTEAAKNENITENVSQTVDENVNNANADSNINQTEKLADEEVPKFTDAQKALEQGNVYFDASLTEKAIDAYKQAVELDEDLAEAHFKLGVAYALEEREDENEAETDPESTEEQSTPKKTKKSKKSKKDERILTKDSEKAFENSIKAYKKYLKENPDDAVAHFNLGRAYNKLYEDEDARKAFEEAVKLSDEDSLYRTELGATLIKLAKYPEAIKQLKKAVELDEYNARAEDLLEQAEAGRKRVDFGAKEKAKQIQTNEK
ncbi:MAG: tetratricopeptide repeat protein [Acidobacteriota bacterium]|nr:tetratricopeptide repeat protein [Acidobacteriota bacterium]